MFDTLRNWYRRWVRMREARYEYLAAILDEVDGRGKRGITRNDADVRQSSPAPVHVDADDDSEKAA